ncbi:hypothetical protein ACIHFE_08120 [Streptomyces sp. NPDC052396]|uniref:hypothetical protein n=1 Tax=Streptomyces sp. NPDC052396 TaxID=3365689 RepID=UPI0037CEFC34
MESYGKRIVPLTTTTRGADGPRRRRVLAGGAAALLLSGCSGTARPGPADGRAPDGSTLRARAARRSAELLGRYDATLAAHPALAPRLRPLRDQVARHVQALGTPTAAPSASPATTPAASPTAPGDEKAALEALADAERRTTEAHTAALANAPGELARLLASIAAAGAAHTYLLGA